MFNKSTIIHEIIIHPRDLNNDINVIIKQKAIQSLVNKCSGYGFIKQIIKVLKKSDGILTNDGSIIYKVTMEVLICNPKIGEQIECDITDYDNRIGKAMMKKDPLLVILFSKNNTLLKIGMKVCGTITDKRIDKSNNIINLLVDIQ